RGPERHVVTELNHRFEDVRPVHAAARVIDGGEKVDIHGNSAGRRPGRAPRRHPPGTRPANEQVRTTRRWLLWAHGVPLPEVPKGARFRLGAAATSSSAGALTWWGSRRPAPSAARAPRGSAGSASGRGPSAGGP